MKKLIIISIISLLLFAFAACSVNTNESENTTATSAENKEAVFEHSNLSSENSLSQIKNLLEKCGVSAERINVFENSVLFFNDSVDKSYLTGDFTEVNLSDEFYDPYELQDMWLEKNPDFNGYNCRITSFTLFGDYIEINKTAQKRDNELFLDTESLEANPSALINKGDMDRFSVMFSVVPTENTKDISVHIKNIIEDFKNRGITFKENEKMSLITLWQHNQWSEEENELFVGHTGVLLRDGDGYMFLEKIAFQEPYQAIKFSTKSQLNDYLMKKYNTSWGQPTAEPFVMENDHPLISE